MRGVVLLLAAGAGERLGEGVPKAFYSLGGVPLVRRAAAGAAGAELVDGLVVAVPAGAEERATKVLDGLARPFRLVAGGDTRQASAASALELADADAVLVHDAARALCPSWLFDNVLRALDAYEAVCPAVPVSDTVKEVSGDAVIRTVDRSSLVAVQTPQGFRTPLYRRAHEAAAFIATDDAALVERIGVKVHIIPGATSNLKITTATDLAIAETLL